MQLFDDPDPEIAAFEIAAWGHKAVQARLSKLVGRQRLAQVVLLVGPPGIGKVSLARWLTQLVLCQSHHSGRPCGACRSCRLVSRSGHPDVDEVEVPLRIEAARDLRRHVALAPAEGEWRLAIIAEVDQSSLGAANSLLKLLEEPPAHVSIIMTASDEASVLPTIRSRSQLIRVGRPSDEAVMAALLESGVEGPAATALASLAGGRVAWALESAADPETTMHQDQNWTAAAERMLTAPSAERLQMASGKLDAEAVSAALAIWKRWWRDALWRSLPGEPSGQGSDRSQGQRPGSPAQVPSPRQAVAMLRRLDEALRQVDAKTQPNLVLESVALAWPRPDVD